MTHEIRTFHFPPAMQKLVDPAHRDVEISQITAKDGRDYLIKGRRLPSATTILGVIDKSTPLMKWMGRMTLDMVDDELLSRGRIQDSDAGSFRDSVEKRVEAEQMRAANEGTIAHDLICRYIEGERPEIDDISRPAVIAALRHIDRERLDPVATEATVWHPSAGYAGQFDLLAKNRDGHLVLLDWKRSKRLYETHACQLAAYSRALLAMGVGDAAAQVVRLPRFEHEQLEARWVNIPPAVRVFAAARELYRLQCSIFDQVWSDAKG